MSSKSREQKSFTKQYPETSKCLNQCLTCRSVGYKPELPEKIYPGFLAENIRSLFAPLAVNDISLCELCERHWDIAHKQK